MVGRFPEPAASENRLRGGEDRKPMGEEIPKVPLLGIDVAAIGVEAFIEYVVAAARRRRRLRICYVNAANYNLAARDRRYAELLRSADLVYADGQAVVWASRFLGRPLPERVNAGDFFDRFAAACARERLKLYLLGSRPGIADRAAAELAARTSGLEIAGTHHGYFDESESGRIVSEINRARPDILVVGMGAPRQEKWVAENFDRLDVAVAWCVGALFEYLSGTRRRAPLWMRKAGLEWAFRLALEPRRLWKRYLLGNWAFAWRVWKDRKAARGRNPPPPQS